MEDKNQNLTPSTLPSQPNTEPEKNKSLKSHAWFILITIIFILLVAGASASYLVLNSNKQVACTLEAKICPDGASVGRTGPKCEFAKCPEPNAADETADWKTYSSNEFDFSLKHPDSWSIEIYDELSAMPDGYILRIETNSKSPNFVFYSADLSVKLKPQNQSLEDFAKPQECIGEGLNGGCKDTTASKQEAIEINGAQGLWQEAMYGQGNYNVKIFIPHGNNVFIFETPNAASPASGHEQDLVNLNVFKQILSTFKFTDSGATPIPSCKPRPTCLDSEPRCIIPETEDMCPPTITPSP